MSKTSSLKYFITNKEIVLIVIFLLLFILIRSIHFTEHLNFSSDQALFSMKSLELWRTKSISLIGPPTSINLNGRYIFQGGLIYGLQLLFLLLGNFDPVRSSYTFMLFCAFMIVPLYLGMKYLSNRLTAIATVIIYTLLPFYIDFSRFLWNPNFQLSLIPLLIYSRGLFHKKQTNTRFFFISLFLGLLLQLHYQFIVIIFALLIYYFIYKKLSLNYFLVFILGFCLGISNLLLFELRNHFYNTQTMLLFLTNTSTFMNKQSNSLFNNPHYILSLSFTFIITILIILQKHIRKWHVISLFIILFTWASLLYIPLSKHGFGMIDEWNYPAEEKAYSIIRSQNITDYAIVHLGYDTLAQVQRYLHLRDSLPVNLDEYRTNKYLFVINDDNSYMNNPAYEVNTFKPSVLIETWQITNKYKLFLLKRT